LREEGKERKGRKEEREGGREEEEEEERKGVLYKLIFVFSCAIVCLLQTCVFLGVQETKRKWGNFCVQEIKEEWGKKKFVARGFGFSRVCWFVGVCVCVCFLEMRLLLLLQ
jgi:hypothetical protein